MRFSEPRAQRTRRPALRRSGAQSLDPGEPTCAKIRRAGVAGGAAGARARACLRLLGLTQKVLKIESKQNLLVFLVPNFLLLDHFVALWSGPQLLGICCACPNYQRVQELKAERMSYCSAPGGAA
jgi:hypothetical protein